MAETTHTAWQREVSWTAGSFFLLPSVQFVGFILPSNSHAEIWTRLRNFFRYLAIGMCHFRYLWNGLCDRHRAEITVMLFIGHSLPVHHFFFLRHSENFFYLVSYCEPSCISHLHRCVSCLEKFLVDSSVKGQYATLPILQVYGPFLNQFSSPLNAF